MLFSKETKNAVKFVIVSVIDARCKLRVAQMRREVADLRDRIKYMDEFSEKFSFLEQHYAYQFMKDRTERATHEEHVH